MRIWYDRADEEEMLTGPTTIRSEIPMDDKNITSHIDHIANDTSDPSCEHCQDPNDRALTGAPMTTSPTTRDDNHTKEMLNSLVDDLKRYADQDEQYSRDDKLPATLRASCEGRSQAFTLCAAWVERLTLFV